MAKQYKSPVERADEEIRRLSGEPTEQDAPEATDEPQAVEQNAPEETPSPEEPKPKAPAEDENSPTYKQRWEALQGMFNGEKRKVEQLTRQLDSLQQQIERVTREQQTSQPLASDATAGDIADHLSALATEYGDDFTRALQGVMRGEIKNMLDQRLKPVEERVGQVAQETEEAQRARFNADLEALAPRWQQTYGEDAFHQWLDAQTEPMTGLTFRELFDDANQKWDTPRIARFFTTFKEATGKATTPKDNGQPTDPRAELVAPGRGSVGSVAQPGQAKVWSIAEVNKFYRDCQQGHFNGRESEAAKIEAEIDRANAEGRIR